jgi:peptidoglycan/LPS O-acetylase OafA/YrhL
MLLLAILIFTENSHGPRVDHRAEAAGLAALGALLIYYEIARRRHPAVLVPFDAGVTGRQVALYYKGILNSTVPPNQVTHYVRNPGNTFGSLLVCAGFSGLFLILSFPNAKQQPLSVQEHVAVSLAAAISIAALASAVRTRLFCDQLLLPKKTGRGRKWVLVPKNQVKRIFE